MTSKPVKTIGILGGGQLGRMLALAAAELGLTCHIYCPEADAIAAQVAAKTTVAPYDDKQALAAFADAVDIVTYEFENVPAQTAAILGAHAPVRPSAHALKVAQDRLTEKTFLRETGVATAPFAAVDNAADLESALQTIGSPAVLKTRTLGYDGKGQVKITVPAEAEDALRAIAHAPAILEGFIPFEREISVIAARGTDGTTRIYDTGENSHKDHILDETRVPARISAELNSQAQAIAGKIITALDYVGVLGVELFVLPPEAGAARLLVNEIAPRVHNSGHWTQDACTVSQFEQHIRAVAGWPLGDPARHADALMKNLIGEEIRTVQETAGAEGTAVHIYGKQDPRPGRKMGHITRLSPLSRPG